MTWIMVVVFYGTAVTVPVHEWQSKDVCSEAAKQVSQLSTGLNGVRAICVPKL